MTPELHRAVAVERIGPAGKDFVVEATAEECGALTRRMGVPAIRSLRCSFHLEREEAEAIMAYGHLTADVVQTCVVTLEDFTANLDVRFSLRCIPQDRVTDDFDPDSPDEFPYADGALDLGEAVAQELALSLEAYPRAPGAVLPEVEPDPDPHPFTELSAWKRRH